MEVSDIYSYIIADIAVLRTHSVSAKLKIHTTRLQESLFCEGGDNCRTTDFTMLAASLEENLMLAK